MGTLASPGLHTGNTGIAILRYQSDHQKNAIDTVRDSLSRNICCLDADILTRKIYLEIDKILTYLLLVKSQLRSEI